MMFGFFKKNSKNNISSDDEKTVENRENQKEQYTQKSLDFKGDENIWTKKGLRKDYLKILKNCKSESSMVELMKIAGRKHRSRFRDEILKPLIQSGYLKATYPETPKHPKQKYRLTNKFVRPKKIE